MSLTRQKREQIMQDILDEIITHPDKVVSNISSKHSISKQTIYSYIRKLENDGVIECIKTSEGSYYQLKENRHNLVFKPVGLNEDQVWIDKIKPILPAMKKNVYDICSYGFTEMLNNAIDHAEATKISIIVEHSYKYIRLWVIDNGIGIFKKIQNHLGLTDPKYSILELAKGKLTSDPTRHSGEGIFFTSRACNEFIILSRGLTFTYDSSRDWLFENEYNKEGTVVIMVINLENEKVLLDIFNQYTDEENQGFTKTTIPVHLMKHEGMELISRSQAKRLISRFDMFNEVLLDFKGIEIIGQAFADELFRVFPSLHTNVHLERINASSTVEKMISHVLNSNKK